MNQPKLTGHAPQGTHTGLTLTDYLAILSRGKWRIFGVFVVVLTAVITISFVMKPTYEGTASLLIDTRQSPSALFEDIRSLGMGLDIMQNEMAVLNSYSMAEEVALRVLDQAYLDSAQTVLLPLVEPIEGDTIYPTRAPLKVVIPRVQAAMTFGTERESYVMTITAASVNPYEAAFLANTYADAYSARNVHTSRARSKALREFLELRVWETKNALKLKEDTLRIYMQSSGVVSLDDETKKLMSQMASLEAQYDANEIDIRSLLTALQSYKDQITQQEKSIAKAIGEASDPYIRLLQDELAQLEVQRDIIVVQDQGAANKSVIDERLLQIDNQIRDLRAKLQTRTEEYIQNILPAGTGSVEIQRDPTGYLKEVKQKFLETQIEIHTLQAKRTAMGEAMDQYERQLSTVPAKSIEHARMLREKTSLEQLSVLLEEKYNEARVTEQSEFGYVEIFDKAVVPLKPSSPKLFLNVALGIVLGLGLGIVYAFGKEMYTQRLYAPEDFLRHGFFVLSIIGRVERGGRLGSRKKRPKGSLSYGEVMNNPYSSITEGFRHLRTNLQAIKNGSSPKTLMVTSPHPGEGKTTVACNLAVVLAQSGKKVLLVDADLREPAVHLAFGMDPKTGLSQVLDGESNLIRKTKVKNLEVLCSGDSATNPAELLASSEMKFLVGQLSEEYDVVLFDTPPVLAVSDSLILSTAVDGIILVASSGVTTSASIKRATEMLKEVRGSIMGIVLNNFNIRKAYGLVPGGSGYGYYGYAEGYGKKTRERIKQDAS